MAVETGDPIGSVLAEIISEGCNQPLLLALELKLSKELHDHSTPLLELGLVVAEKTLDRRIHTRNRTFDDTYRIIQTAVTKCNLLNRLGRHHEALEASLEAKRWSQVLKNFHQNLGEYAEAVSSVIAYDSYENAGENEKAHNAILQAYRFFSSSWNEDSQLESYQSPGDFCKQMHAAAYNLSLSFLNEGDLASAMSLMRWTVGFGRHLSASNPARHKRILADSLVAMSKIIGELDRSSKESLDLSLEAVDLLVQLTASRPDIFLPSLALGLNNLSAFQVDFGMKEDALISISQSVSIYRSLAQVRDLAFGPALALGLVNLGRTLNSLGLHQDAADATQEGIEKLRYLSEVHPDRFLPDLALGLNNLGTHLIYLGYRQKAIKAGREALAIRMHMARVHPGLFELECLRSIHNLAFFYIKPLLPRSKTPAFTVIKKGLHFLTAITLAPVVLKQVVLPNAIDRIKAAFDVDS